MLGRKTARRKASLGAFLFALYQTHARGGRGGGDLMKTAVRRSRGRAAGRIQAAAPGPAAGGEPPGGTGGGAVGGPSCARLSRAGAWGAKAGRVSARPFALDAAAGSGSAHRQFRGSWRRRDYSCSLMRPDLRGGPPARAVP